MFKKVEKERKVKSEPEVIVVLALFNNSILTGPQRSFFSPTAHVTGTGRPAAHRQRPAETQQTGQLDEPAGV